MSRPQNERQPSIEDAMDSVHDTDATEYQSVRGCLTLTALIIICSIIAVAFIVLFGSPD